MVGEQFYSERRCETAIGDIASVPDRPAVFMIWTDGAQPYLARTGLLRRRLLRLLRESQTPSRLLNLHGLARRIEFWLSGSQLESSLLFHALAKQHFPDQYLRIAKLKMPAYVKLTLSNPFPRTHVTTRIGGGSALYYGPFFTRTAAEHFESQALDLFQIRRCQENLEPRADHPGCIYGEMGMCLRPCQKVVGVDEYASETARFRLFLQSSGQSLLDSVGANRDRFSEEMQFEDAARQHKRYERIEQVLALRDGLVTDAAALCGIAVTPSLKPGAVSLWPMENGVWRDPADFVVEAADAAMVPLDRRLRECVASLQPACAASSDRPEHIALLSKWFYSTWRDGEWLPCRSLADIPYRKFANAVARVAKGTSSNETKQRSS